MDINYNILTVLRHRFIHLELPSVLTQPLLEDGHNYFQTRPFNVSLSLCYLPYLLSVTFILKCNCTCMVMKKSELYIKQFQNYPNITITFEYSRIYYIHVCFLCRLLRKGRILMFTSEPSPPPDVPPGHVKLHRPTG